MKQKKEREGDSRVQSTKTRTLATIAETMSRPNLNKMRNSQPLKQLFDKNKEIFQVNYTRHLLPSLRTRHYKLLPFNPSLLCFKKESDSNQGSKVLGLKTLQQINQTCQWARIPQISLSNL